MIVRTVILFTFFAFFIGIAQTTGPIINMLLMMGLDYPAKVSIGLTYLFLAGGAVASVWKTSVRKNPQTKKSFVKLDLIQLTFPTMSSGALFGSLTKNFFSEVGLTVLFILLFIYLIYDMIRAMRAPQDAPGDQRRNQILIQLQQLNTGQNLTQKLVQSNQKIQMSKTLIDYENRTSSQCRMFQLVVICIFFYCFTVLTSLMRGSKSSRSIIGIHPCSPTGWGLLFGHLLISTTVGVLIAKKINSDAQGFTPQQIKKYSVQVTKDNVWYFLITGFVAGFLAALMAIGSTLILVPIWLRLGVEKNFAANSTPVLIFSSSFITFSIAYFNHVFEHVSPYALVFYFVFSFLSSAFVRDIIFHLNRKFRFERLALFLLLFVEVCTLVMLVPFQINRLMNDYENIVSFGTIC